MESLYSTRWRSMVVKKREEEEEGMGMSSSSLPSLSPEGTGATTTTTTKPAAAPSAPCGDSSSGGGEALYKVLDQVGEGWNGEEDDLDQLFDRIREVREMSGSLGDGERRRRAAETAMYLARVLGIDEEEEGEERDD